MIYLLLILIGFGLMFPRNISISKKSELRRPKTVVFGAILIIGSMIAKYSSEGADVYGYPTVNPWLFGIPILVAISSAVLLKQPKEITADVATRGNYADKTANILTWSIIGLVGLIVLYFTLGAIATW